MSPKALFLIRRLATYANPEFYAKQAMRQSTFGTSRVTVLYDEDSDNIILPRGLEIDLVDKFNSAGVKYKMIDERNAGKSIKVDFIGELTDHQSEALEKLSENTDGVLSATTGFGKTVIGAKLIAEKKCSTLILVHTK